MLLLRSPPTLAALKFESSVVELFMALLLAPIPRFCELQAGPYDDDKWDTFCDPEVPGEPIIPKEERWW